MSNRILSFKSEQLPQYLAGLGLTPYQITYVIYRLFREIKTLGQLTPGEDNAIHLDKEIILNWAKDPLLDSCLSSLFLKLQRTKNWNFLFQKDGASASLSAPGLWHNPHGAEPNISPELDIEEEIEIIDFVRFLAECGIDPNLVDGAIKEKSLLKGSVQ